ncbi:MAG TPA: chorismate mutase [Actinobacteria bacterium]|jgi:chorismate mutase|nr:chorismate mutase [Actinomycetota bacterium]
MTLRGIRGATCLTADDADEMREAVSELLGAILERNALHTDDLISIVLTGTPDLTCAFPAAGARDFGLVDVPLLCAQEMDIDGALPLTVRVLVHADMAVPRPAVQHVYLRGAEVLRQDLAQ